MTDSDRFELGSGCYLVYESDSSGKLFAHYSEKPVPNALGYWAPGEGKKIQGFKFKRNQGRSELIGGCAGGLAGRKQFYTGWVQFLKLAKNYNGSAVLLPRKNDTQGLDVQLFGYNSEEVIEEFEACTVFEVASLQGVACLPQGENIYQGIQNTNLSYFLTQGAKSGYTSTV